MVYAASWNRSVKTEIPDFYNSLQTKLFKNFTLVDQAGPGVIKPQIALIDATADCARSARSQLSYRRRACSKWLSCW